LQRKTGTFAKRKNLDGFRGAYYDKMMTQKRVCSIVRFGTLN
jgi:hypothetical protein